MKTFKAVVKHHQWSNLTEYDVASKTFAEAVRKVKSVCRKKGYKRPEFISVIKTANLDA